MIKAELVKFQVRWYFILIMVLPIAQQWQKLRIPVFELHSELWKVYCEYFGAVWSYFDEIQGWF